MRLLVALFCLMATPALAHMRSESHSRWQVQGTQLIGTAQVDLVRLTQLFTSPADAADPAGVWARELMATTRVEQNGKACKLDRAQPLAAATGSVRVELVISCPAPIDRVATSLRIGAFQAASLSHVHYLQVRVGALDREAVITASRPTLVIDRRGAPSPGFWRFAHLGVFHVLSGLDHIAFLLALAMLVGRPGAVLIAATGFTLGHSITLALVALGRIAPDVQAIEALIGFTVLFAAWEGLSVRVALPRWPSVLAAAVIIALPFAARMTGGQGLPLAVALGGAIFCLCAARVPGDWLRRHCWVLAAAFGLAHGAGFAGALMSYQVPPERLVSSLIAFNLGVEAGQLIALAIFAGLVVITRRLPAARLRLAEHVLLSALGGLGLFWFVSRALA